MQGVLVLTQTGVLLVLTQMGMQEEDVVCLHYLHPQYSVYVVWSQWNVIWCVCITSTLSAQSMLPNTAGGH